MEMKSLLTQFISRFEKFNDDEIEAIVENMRTESFKKGTIILKEGEVCNKCYFVLRGCLRQYKMINGEEKTTGFYLDGEAAVLYSSYLHKTPSEYYLSCVEDCVLTTGTREEEEALHKKYPGLSHMIHALMPRDYTKVEDRIAFLNFYKPEERYRILMKTEPELLKRVPLYQLASYIGVTPESFSRIRKRFMRNDK